VSEQILNSTSAQLGYTVPFTLVDAGKYRAEDKSDTTKTKQNPQKANNAKYSKTELAWFSRLIRHSEGNEVGLFYNAPSPHRPYEFTVKNRPIRFELQVASFLTVLSRQQLRPRYEELM